MAARNFYFVVNSSVIGQDHVSVRTVAKQSDDRGMSTPQNPHDAPLSTLPADNSAQALDLRQHVVTVHGVINRVARDENVAVELGYRRFGYNESVAIVMED